MKRTPQMKRRLRKHLLGALLAMLVAAKLISLSVIASMGNSAFASEEYNVSIKRYSWLRVGNIVERDIAYFNRGTAYAKSGSLEEGQRDLAGALAIAPTNRECRVRVNLALTIEARADQQLENKQWVPALVLLAEGQQVVDDGKDCFPPSSGGKGGKSGKEGKEGEKESEAGKELAKAQDRLKKKSQDAKDGKEGKEGDADDAQSSKTPEKAPPEDKQDQLENQMKEAQKERLRADGQSKTADAEPAKYDDKTW